MSLCDTMSCAPGSSNVSVLCHDLLIGLITKYRHSAQLNRGLEEGRIYFIYSTCPLVVACNYILRRYSAALGGRCCTSNRRGAAGLELPEEERALGGEASWKAFSFIKSLTNMLLVYLHELPTMFRV